MIENDDLNDMPTRRQMSISMDLVGVEASVESTIDTGGIVMGLCFMWKR